MAHPPGTQQERVEPDSCACGPGHPQGPRSRLPCPASGPSRTKCVAHPPAARRHSWTGSVASPRPAGPERGVQVPQASSRDRGWAWAPHLDGCRREVVHKVCRRAVPLARVSGERGASPPPRPPCGVRSAPHPDRGAAGASVAMVTRRAPLSAAGGTSAAGGARSLSPELGAGRTGHGTPRAPHKHAALSHPAPTHRILTRTQQNTRRSARAEPVRTHHSRRTPHPPHAVRIAFHASHTHCKYSYNTHSHTLNPLGTRTPEDALLEQAPRSLHSQARTRRGSQPGPRTRSKLMHPSPL